jgi:hypothetical protein
MKSLGSAEVTLKEALIKYSWVASKYMSPALHVTTG